MILVASDLWPQIYKASFYIFNFLNAYFITPFIDKSSSLSPWKTLFPT